MPSVTMPTVTYAESSHLDRGEVPPRLPEPSQPRERAAPRTVVWRHVVYAVAYLVLGVAFLVVFHSWVGLFAVFAGLVLGLRRLGRGRSHFGCHSCVVPT